MISKTEFDAKVESIKKLIGYKELIESDTTTDEFKIMDSQVDVSLFVQTKRTKEEIDTLIRTFNSEILNINLMIDVMDQSAIDDLESKLELEHDLNLKPILDNHNQNITDKINNGALEEYTLDKAGIKMYLTFILDLLNNTTPIEIIANIPDELTVEQKIKLDSLDITEEQKVRITEKYKLYYTNIKDNILNIDVLSIYDGILDTIDFSIKQTILF